MTAPVIGAQATSSFRRSTSQLFAGTVVGQMLVAVTFGVIARGLGPTVIGLVAALLGISAVAQDLFDFGTSAWLSRELASGRLGTSRARTLVRRRGAILLIVGLCCGVAAAFGGARREFIVAVLLYVVCAVANAGTHARLRAFGQFRRSAIHLALERTAWLVMTVAILTAHLTNELSAAAVIATMGIAYAVSATLAPRWPHGDSDAPGCDEPSSDVSMRRLYRRSAAFGVMGLASDLQQLDATLAASWTSVAVAGEVGVASKFSGALRAVPSVVSLVVFRSAAVGGKEGRSSSTSALRISAVLAGLIALFAPISPFVAVLLLGGQYKGAAAAIITYTLGTALVVASQPLVAVLTAVGADRVVSVLVGAATVAGLLLGSLLIHGLGAVGMGLGFVLGQIVIFLGCVLLYRRHLRETHNDLLDELPAGSAPARGSTGLA